MSCFKVVSPGFLSLLQDAGRYGYHGVGLTTSGPMDALAFNWANLLCGNPVDAVAIEASVGGLTLESQADTVIAVTGAQVPFTINGDEAQLWRSHKIKAGDTIALSFATNGCRSYIAVAGGFQVEQSFGSVATVVREGIGGLAGKALQAGDQLPVKGIDAPCLELPEQLRPHYSKEITLRVIPSYQEQSFSRVQQRIFFGSEYTVSDRCDRMGYKVEGPAIAADVSAMLSEGICLGAIQVPPDGQPIVLMNDRQTIGGYPKIGAVLSLDLAKLAQQMPGAKVRFEPITIDCAHNALHLAKSQFERAQSRLTVLEQ
ncbi:biotin-dependent carboxyltransferase family protein [Dasania sp. GY-MA-18]|uniref:Biotin-dependent carboxyltransferase family protein n=1 Tax=Dasania phycosphaerae TaxID=2950436 RepID=A0A9J6RMW6_9GAMM|nr:MULTISPECIES: biotin-dependent carboxyltransferase family protein [Dasania]MCR8923636.1 biotin-dependent carboxyltransferase family protein [Dasania sp. GY-MA-18]MCZ0866070.1 biotin-dependent carboxyltransferase family protein [Dasania phycosphaerae]MCZ0869794.1 biotin-dependent carboxyltransferase family protein [Dasania phycosphaerae]